MKRLVHTSKTQHNIGNIPFLSRFDQLHVLCYSMERTNIINDCLVFLKMEQYHGASVLCFRMKVEIVDEVHSCTCDTTIDCTRL